MEINRTQLNLLQGFFAHCFCVYHDGVKQDFSFWATQLDGAAVPWSIQNQIAQAAETRSNLGYYLTTLLKNIGVTVDYTAV